MREQEESHDARARAEAERGGVGDVETAGETTAAATIGGNNASVKPVGAGTLVKVADAPDQEVHGDG